MVDTTAVSKPITDVNATNVSCSLESYKLHNSKCHTIKVAEQHITYCSAYRIGSMIKRKLHLRIAVTSYKFNYVRMAIRKTNSFKGKIIALNESLKNIGINIAEKLYEFFKLCVQITFCIQTGRISLLFSMFVINRIISTITSFFGQIKKTFINHIKQKFVDKRVINVIESLSQLISKFGNLLSSIICLCKFKIPSIHGTFIDELMQTIQIVETTKSIANMPQSISESAKKVIENAKEFSSVEKLKEIAKSTLDKIKQTLKEIFISFLSIKGVITLIQNIFHNIRKQIYNIIEERLDSKITI